MTLHDQILSQQFERGRADALDLRSRAPELDGTATISEERKAPVFDPEKDYSDWPAGSPVRELVNGEYQVFKLLTPYNAAHYPGSTPVNSPSIWSVCHTTDPRKAKPYTSPHGTSGLWMLGECCTDPNMPDPAQVYRSLVDDGAFAPSAYAENWEKVDAPTENYLWR